MSEMRAIGGLVRLLHVNCSSLPSVDSFKGIGPGIFLIFFASC